ncbi:MAG: hypothetical protein DRP20_02515 [Thermotogae bacterium]|nr:MAG: hypothetical protein DRP20_02515 [Thermotogota bacterium]
MIHLDDFTVSYKALEDRVSTLIDSLEKLQRNLDLDMKIGITPYFGRIRFSVYGLDEKEPPVTAVATFTIHSKNDEILEKIAESGINYEELSKTADHSFFKLFGDNESALVFLDGLNEEMPMIEPSPGVVITFVKISKVSNLNKENLAKKLVEKYVLDRFNFSSDFQINIEEDSLGFLI